MAKIEAQMIKNIVVLLKIPLAIYPHRVYNADVHEKASKKSSGNIHENDYKILLLKYVSRMPDHV